MQGEKKEVIHIAGAGTVGMYVLVGALGMLFLASLLGYFVIRFNPMPPAPNANPLAAPSPEHYRPWPPAGYPAFPSSLWISTAVILASSVTIQLALTAIKRGNEKTLRVQLMATAALGLLFLALQGVNWYEFVRQLTAAQRTGPYYNFFLILTGLHAAHVVGGLIPLGIVICRAYMGRYSANYHPGVRYCTIYWHFLDVIWLMLFAALVLI